MADTSVNNGGSAFPVKDPNLEYWQPGMSLRDYFAGVALGAFLIAIKGVGAEGINPKFLSAAAYDQADAMLAERDK